MIQSTARFHIIFDLRLIVLATLSSNSPRIIPSCKSYFRYFGHLACMGPAYEWEDLVLAALLRMCARIENHAHLSTVLLLLVMKMLFYLLISYSYVARLLILCIIITFLTGPTLIIIL